MKKTTIELELITPAYLGNATSAPEIRLPSIKGLLRFWYRAIDPDYRKHEATIFGSASDKRVSPIVLRFRKKYPQFRKCHLLISPSNERTESCIQGIKDVDEFRKRYQGLSYLAFPMGLKDGIRNALSANQRFTIDCIDLRDNLPARSIRRYAMAWWAFVIIGGVGSRSRRGFGSLSVASIHSGEKPFVLLRQYPNITKLKNWWNLFERGMNLINKWFKTNHKNDHFHIGSGTRFLLFGSNNSSGNGFHTWFDALNSFGTKFMQFRKNLSEEAKMALGLPITGQKQENIAKGSGRGASPLMARVVRIGNRFFVLVTITKSPVCPKNTSLIKGTKGSPLKEPDYRILDTIWMEWKDNAIHSLEVK